MKMDASISQLNIAIIVLYFETVQQKEACAANVLYKNS